MQGNHRLFTGIITLLILATGCRKYKEVPELNHPAYIRVFNMISNTPTVIRNGEVNTFVTFLMDPVMDPKSPVARTAAVVGDFLTTRPFYTISYPTDAANTVTGAGYVNYEYPGREHVLAAPPINGFDCSSWAQVPAGKHRIMFVSRPPSNIPFDSLTVAQRSLIIADTLIDLQAGELYTVEIALADQANDRYRPYIRKEEFAHKQYASDSLYLAIYNVSAYVDRGNVNVYSPVRAWFRDSLTLTGAAYVYNYLFTSFDTVPGFSHIHSQINEHFNEQAVNMVFPAAPSAAFFDVQGVISPYSKLPYNTLDLGTIYSGRTFNLNFSLSPVNYVPNIYNDGVYGSNETLPNLNLLATQGGRTQIFPTINIIEIVNDRIFMTQVQRGFSQTVQ